MSNYTVDEDFLLNVSEHYLTDILFALTNRTNECLISIDAAGIIESMYWKMAIKSEVVRFFMDRTLNFNPKPFHKVDVDLSEIKSSQDRFLTLCSQTIGDKKLITNSKYKFPQEGFIGSKKYLYNTKKIKIFDKDEARKDVTKCCCTVVKKKVKRGGMNIKKAKIKDSFNKGK